MKPLMLADINDRITQARKELISMGIDWKNIDLSVIVGKSQIEDMKNMTYSGNIKGDTGITLLESVGITVIESTMDSVLEICWVIPRTIKY